MQVTEWWLSPLDRYGDALEVYYLDSRAEAVAEHASRLGDHPDAEAWRLERVVRRYRSDGDLADEAVNLEAYL